MQPTQEELRFLELAREKKLSLNSSALVVIEKVQEFVPFQTLTITKDQLGRPNQYLISSSQKIVVSEVGIVAIK